MGTIRKSDIHVEMKKLEKAGQRLEKTDKKDWIAYNSQMNILTDRYINEAKDISEANRQKVNADTAHEFTEQLWRSMGKTRIHQGILDQELIVHPSEDPSWEKIGPNKYRKITLKEK